MAGAPDRKRRAHGWLMLAPGAVLLFGRLFGGDIQAWYRTHDPVLARVIGGSISLLIVAFAVWSVIYAYSKSRS